MRPFFSGGNMGIKEEKARAEAEAAARAEAEAAARAEAEAAARAEAEAAARAEAEAAARAEADMVEAAVLRDCGFGGHGEVVKLTPADAKAGYEHGMLDLHPDAIAAAKAK
jgi:fused signal recognition particle receptor